MYMHSQVPATPPRELMRDYSIIFGSTEVVQQLALVLNEVARCTTLELIKKP